MVKVRFVNTFPLLILRDTVWAEDKNPIRIHRQTYTDYQQL